MVLSIGDDGLDVIKSKRYCLLYWFAKHYSTYFL